MSPSDSHRRPTLRLAAPPMSCQFPDAFAVPHANTSRNSTLERRHFLNTIQRKRHVDRAPTQRAAHRLSPVPWFCFDGCVTSTRSAANASCMSSNVTSRDATHYCGPLCCAVRVAVVPPRLTRLPRTWHSSGERSVLGLSPTLWAAASRDLTGEMFMAMGLIYLEYCIGKQTSYLEDEQLTDLR